MAEITIVQAPVEIQLMLLGIIVIVGVALQIGLGYFRNKQQYAEKVNNGKIVVTIIISGFAAYFLVAPQIGNINWDLSDPIPIITAVLTLIAAIGGADAIIKKTTNIGKTKGETLATLDEKIKNLTKKKDELAG